MKTLRVYDFSLPPLALSLRTGQGKIFYFALFNMLTKRDQILISALYLLACAWVWPFVRYYVDNPDSFQYISIAEHIIKGKWQFVFNGYWSPIISWLLAPFVVLFKDGIDAFKYLQIVIGLFVISQWWKFLSLVNIPLQIKKAIGYGCIPFVVNFALINLTPDLLFVGILLAYIIALVNWLEKKSDGSELGWYCAGLYLTKSFGLFIFIFLFFIAWRMKGELIPTYVKKKMIKPLLIVCGGWIILISIHHGHFTLSESARFNLTYEVAPVKNQIVKLPVLSSGLLPPSNSEAISAWEEPGSQVQLTPLNPLKDPIHYAKVVERNIYSIYYSDFRNQFGLLFIISFVLFLFFRRKENDIPLWIKISLAVIIGMYGGYSLILIHARYVWICSLLFIPMTIYFFSELRSINFAKTTRDIFFVGIIIFSCKRPIKEVLLNGDREVNPLQLYQMIRSPKESMEIFYRREQELHHDIKIMKKELAEGQNFASIEDDSNERDVYSEGLMIAYEMKGKYYGVSQNIDSSFTGYVISKSVLDKTLVFEGGKSNLKIYKW